MNKKGLEALKEYQRKIKSGEIEKQPNLTPVEKALKYPKSLRAAINAYCWDCGGESRTEVTFCTVTNCPLYHLRPWQKKEKTE